MPLIQSGMSLVLSSVVTSGLGFLFWIVAARQYSSADLGIGSAVITAMILLTDFSQIGLKTGLVRFLPTARSDTRRLIKASYGIAIIIAGLAALVFVAGIEIWTPDLIGLRDSRLIATLFVLATAFWVIFLLEDSVLLGLRLAPWVPIENGIFGLLKIVLLFPLAAVSDEFGVFLAWALPVFVIVVVVNIGVGRHLERSEAEVPTTGGVQTNGNGSTSSHVSPASNGSTTSSTSTKSNGSKPPGIVLRDVLSFSLVDWTASAGRTAVIGILPLLVLAELDASQSAYYFLAWTIAYSVYILSANIGDALVAEASYDEANVDRHTLHSGLLSMAISAPVVLVATAAAPWILQAFGTEYATEATPVLRLLLLGAIPNVVTRTYIGRLRAERRMKVVFGYEFALSLSVLVLGWLLLGPFGIVGLGFAWLIMLTVAALYALAAESVWWWAPKLDPRLARFVDRVAARLHSVGLRLPSPALDGAVKRSLQDRYSSRPRWRRVASDDDVQTVLVEGHEGRPPLRIELAKTPWGNDLLARRRSSLLEMGDITGLAALRAHVPYPIDHDSTMPEHYLVGAAVTGRPGGIRSRVPSEGRVASVIEAVSDLHEATADWMTLDHEALDRWVSQPLRHLGQTGRATPDEVVAIGRVICDGLAGRVVPSARVHGWLTLDNALFDPGDKLTGLINWEWSDVGPEFLDRATLALSALSVDSGEDLGHLVVQLLEEPEAMLNHSAITTKSIPDVDGRSIVLLAWLHLVAPVLRSMSGGQDVHYWVARNVTPVIASGLAKEPVRP